MKCNTSFYSIHPKVFFSLLASGVCCRVLSSITVNGLVGNIVFGKKWQKQLKKKTVLKIKGVKK